jgi:hypothetical protein
MAAKRLAPCWVRCLVFASVGSVARKACRTAS